MKISHLRDAKGRQPPAAMIRVEVNDDFFRTRAIPTRNGTDYVYLVRALLTSWCTVYTVICLPGSGLTCCRTHPAGECFAWPALRCSGWDSTLTCPPWTHAS